MHGINKKTICIAGTNTCAINALNYLLKKKYKNFEIVALPDKSDNGRDKWQPSFKKFAKNKRVKIVSLEILYNIKNLYLFSLEYRNVLKVNCFKSKKLFNIHFSLLPKYRGCHTNYLQILNGEKKSGVTIHKIEKGIDTGKIISKLTFKININDTSYENYFKLMKYSLIIFKKNLDKILNDNYKLTNQNLKRGTYYSRKSVNYKNIVILNKFNHDIKTHNKIRALIFPPFQLPIYNGKKIIKSIYKNNKIKLKYK